MQIALGHYLTFRVPSDAEVDPGGTGAINYPDGGQELKFQNFWIGRNALFSEPSYPPKPYAFLPFNFSGAVINKQGDNIEASLVFPNSDVSRGFMDQAVRERWLAVVRVVLVDNLEDPEQVPSMLYKYKGFVSGGGWTPSELSMSLSSVMDAAKANIPARTLNQRSVGDVPSSGNVSLQ